MIEQTKITFLFVFTFFMCFIQVKSQRWEVSNSIMSNDNVAINKSLIDNNNNLYAIGHFKGDLTIGDSFYSASSSDIYISRFNSDFSLAWSNKIGGPGFDFQGSMAYNNSNIYLTGPFGNNGQVCYFSANDSLVSDGSWDVYLANYSTNGVLQWKKHIGRGASNQFDSRITVGDNSNLLVPITYKDSIQISDTIIYGTPGAFNNSISKFSNNGTLIWSKNIKATGDVFIEEVSFFSNSYFFIGRYKDTIFYENDTVVGSTNNFDIFLLKTSHNGEIDSTSWIKSFKGNYNDVAGSLTQDSYGNFYFTGYFQSDSLFIDSNNVLINEYSPNEDFYLIKYNKNGELQWAKSFGRAGNDRATDMSVKDDILYVTGMFSDTIIFGDDTLHSNGTGDADFFLGTFDTDGNKLRAVGIKSYGSGDEFGKSISVSSDISAFVSASFKSDSIIIGDSLYRRQGTRNSFIGKYVPLFSATFDSKTNASCNNGADGSLSVKTYFGQAPYTYSWSHADTLNNDTATNLSAGTYTVTVTDMRDSTDVITETITEPDPIVFNASITNVTGCYGDSTGAIDITPTGGTTPYQSYFWAAANDGVVDLNAQDQTGLISDMYSVTLMDKNGCIADTSIFISQPDNMIFNGSSVTHIGYQNDGAIDLAVSGGTGTEGNFSYSWNGPESFSESTQDISGLTEGGTYGVSVTDENTCEFDTSFSIIDSTVLSIYFKPADVEDVDCNGESTGSAIITVEGQNGALTYSWSHDAGLNDSTASNLSAGQYSVSVTDDDTTVVDSVVIEEPAVLNGTINGITTDMLDCHGDTDGFVDLEVSGGTTPRTYLWSNGETSQDISNVSAGTYSVTVTDANGCQDVASHTIQEPSQVVAGVAIETAIACYGDHGALKGSGSGGTGSYTYQWNDGGNQTTRIADDLEAGTYIVTVTDGNSCQDTAKGTLTNPGRINIDDVTGTFSLDCYGDNNGSISVTSSGGKGVHTYELFPDNISNTTGSFSGLDANLYTIYVRDTNSCETDTAIEITQPGQIVINTIEKNDISCNGQNDGSININPTGGNGSYSYDWSNGADSQDISNLAAATYTITVTDAKSCTRSKSYNISEPAKLTLSNYTVSHLACHQDSSGSIDITPAGGTTPYNFSWSDGSDTEDIDSLLAGSYSLTITDANACTFDTTFNVTQPANITFNAAVTQITGCYGDSSGAIDLTPAGGTSPFDYYWTADSLGDVDLNAEDQTGLISDDYTVTITDNNGCTADTSISINQPQNMHFENSTVTHIGDSNDGAVDLSVSGGTGSVGNFSYDWNGPGSFSETSQDIGGLTNGGQYKVTVTDENLCEFDTTFNVIDSTTITIFFDPADVNDVQCNGESNGSAIISVTGENGNVTYSWSHDGSLDDSVATDLSAGKYYVTVEDDFSSAIDSVTIEEPNPLLLSVNATDTLNCYGDANGQIDLTVTGGTKIYSYEWSNSSITQDISDLSSGTYKVTVTDANGCVDSLTHQIHEPEQLVADVSVGTALKCYGVDDGVLTASGTGGAGVYTYSWNDVDNQSTQTASNLGEGTYTVTVSDENACQDTAKGTLTYPDEISITAIGKRELDCHGDADGNIDISISGGTGGYSFEWSNNETSEDISGLVAGDYTVTVTDGNGCTKIKTYSVTEPQQIDLSASTSSNVSCHGEDNGEIDLSVSGGIVLAGYDYSWSNGSTFEDRVSLSAGTYQVTVTDDNSCAADTSITISEPAVIDLSQTLSTDVSCYGSSDGSINLSVTGGSGNYSYSWSNGAETKDLADISQGSYEVTVTDENNCTRDTSITISQPAAIELSTALSDVSCHGSSDGSIDLTVSGGTPDYSYSWSNGANTQDISNVAGGSYTVTVTDQNSCSKDTSLTIDEPVNLTFNADVTHITGCYGDSTGAINLNVEGGVLPIEYSWSAANDGEVVFAQEDQSELVSDTFLVTITDKNGCAADTAIYIEQPEKIYFNNSSVTHIGDAEDGAVDLAVTGGTGNVSNYSYSWTGPDSYSASNQDISGLIFGGHYNVTVTDENNCNVDTVFNVIDSTQLSIFFQPEDIVDVTCNGQGNGSAIVTVEGESGAVTYSWSHDENVDDSVATDLSGGKYYVTVTDQQTSVVDSVIIDEPDALLLSVSATDTLDCFGDADGSIDLQVSGGVKSYNYLWSNGSTQQDISNLESGDYSVTVTDANGCGDSLSHQIYQPEQLMAEVSIENTISCNGSNDGSLGASGTGGTGSYAYAWNDTENQTTQIADNLDAGTYIVTITDQHACQDTAKATLTEPDKMALEAVGKFRLDCYGDEDGNIDVTVTGGSGNYSFNWSNEETTEDLSGLGAGAYSLTVLDTNGCVLDTNFTIMEPTAIDLSATSTDVVCHGSSDGSIELSVSGGEGTYAFAWSNGAETEDISELAAGTYEVTVTDTNGCASDTSIVITEPAPIEITRDSVQNVTCNGGMDGAGYISVSGGDGNFAYSWSDGSEQQDLTGVAAGTYKVIVTDGNGCQDSTEVTITQPDPILIAQDSVHQVSCSGNLDGDIYISVSGGTGSYAYEWSNGSTTQDNENIAAGTYKVIVSDANGCRDSLEVTLTGADPVEITRDSVQNVTCNGGMDGAGYISVSGGDGNFAYSWSDGSEQQDLTGVAAGTYKVIVTDGNGCQDSTEVTITQPDPILIAQDSVHQVSCSGNLDGDIYISVSGGTGSYAYEWSNGSTTQDNENIAAGTYKVIVSDANGCRDSLEVTLTGADPVEITRDSVQNVTCNGGEDGAIYITTEGGEGLLTHEWSNGSIFPDITNLPAGNYTITVTDRNECQSTMSFEINEPSEITGEAEVEDVSCNGAADGSASIDATGGTPEYLYIWPDGDTAQFRNDLTAGSYEVTIKDDNQCESNLSVDINEPDALTLEIADKNDILCHGNANGSASIEISGGTPEYDIQWSNDEEEERITGLAQGEYNVTVTDNNGCQVVGSVTINEPDPIVVDYALTRDSTQKLDAGNIQIIASGGTGQLEYSLNNAPYVDNDGRFMDLNSEMDYQLYIKDDNECVFMDDSNIVNQIVKSTNISIAQRPQLMIPTIISPNGDGFDEQWIIGNIHKYPDNEVYIFNSKGQIVYYEKGYEQSWDGTTSNGTLLKSGIYMYRIILNDKYLYRGKLLLEY